MGLQFGKFKISNSDDVFFGYCLLTLSEDSYVMLFQEHRMNNVEEIVGRMQQSWLSEDDVFDSITDAVD